MSRLSEKISVQVTEIETIIDKLDCNNQEKYKEELRILKSQYEEKLEYHNKEVSEGTLVLTDEETIYLEYNIALENIYNEVSLLLYIKNIKDFCLNLKLDENNLYEKLIYFENVEEQFNKIKKRCDSNTIDELNKIIYNTLYEFIYNEIKYFDEDTILQGINEKERVYLTKILQENLNDSFEEDTVNIISYYELKGESILNKDVINRLVETELKNKNLERKIINRNPINEEFKEQIKEKRKKKSLVDRIKSVLKRKISVKQFTEKYGINPISRKQDPKLLELDLSIIDFTGELVHQSDFSNTNVDIDPQKIKNKNLYNTNLENVDMSDKDFTGVNLLCTNLKNTNANIAPQKIERRDLRYANLGGLDFTGKSFDEVYIEGTQFEGAKNLNIDFQKIYNKRLGNTNLKGIDLSEKNLNGLYLVGTNLEDTNANIDPQRVQKHQLMGTILRGLDLSNKDFSGVNIEEADFRSANIEGANFKNAINIESAIFDDKQKEYIENQLKEQQDKETYDIETDIQEDKVSRETKIVKPEFIRRKNNDDNRQVLINKLLMDEKFDKHINDKNNIKIKESIFDLAYDKYRSSDYADKISKKGRK